MKVKKVKLRLDYSIPIHKPSSGKCYSSIDEIIKNKIINKEYHHTKFPQVGNYYLDIKYIVDMSNCYILIGPSHITGKVSFCHGPYKAYPLQILIQ